MGVVCLFSHGFSPVDTELSDPGLVNEDSAFDVLYQLLGRELVILLLRVVFSEDVVDVVANPDELLLLVTNSYYEGRDT